MTDECRREFEKWRSTQGGNISLDNYEAFMAGRQSRTKPEGVDIAEGGWVIELAASPVSSPNYWAGSSLWVPDHMKAIRFARKKDAQQAADFMLDGMKIRICEHAWNLTAKE